MEDGAMSKKTPTNEKDVVSIFICDSQPLFRFGLKLAIEKHEGLKVVGEAGSKDELLDALPRSNPEVLLLDMSIARLENFCLLRQIKVQYPAVKVIVLSPKSVHLTEILAVIQEGVAGCLFRDSPPELVLSAIQSVAKGVPWIQREFTELIFQIFNSLPDEPIRTLTEKERQILILLAKGLTNKEIAKQLGLSLQTVKTHVSHILQKLKVKSRSEAARYAIILMKSSLDGKKLVSPAKSS